MQALTLPQLQQEERDALGALTTLTRLSFGAAGKGAVGPSLLPLARLQVLHVSLSHTLERFIVLHPALHWASLRRMASLRRLSVDHLAANTLFPSPDVNWTDEAPAGLQADALLAALPQIEDVALR